MQLDRCHLPVLSIVREFNELVNMRPQELKKWLGGDDSKESGWSRDDGCESCCCPCKVRAELLQKQPKRSAMILELELLAYWRNTRRAMTSRSMRRMILPTCERLFRTTNGIWPKRKRRSKIRIGRSFQKTAKHCVNC